MFNEAAATLTNTILAASGGGNCTGVITSGGHNLASDGTCTALVAGGDQPNTDPQLGSLADNGGPTLTHLPASSSPAIDAGGSGANGCPATDQRGVARPQGPACDSGAVERATAPAPPRDSTPPTTTASASGYTFGAWTNQAVTVTLTASDGSGAGVDKTYYKVDDATGFTTGTSVMIGAPSTHSNDGTHTVTYYSTDLAGNSEAPTTVTVKIDTTAPTVTCATTPAFLLRQTGTRVTATVTDSGAGPAVSQVSAAASTPAVGTFSTTLAGADNAGNTASAGCPYQVAYKVYLLTNSVQNGPVTVTLQLQDVNGVNQSSASIAVTATAIVDSTGKVVQKLNAPFTFKSTGPSGAAGGTYGYKPNTRGLTKGATYILRFTAANDPTTHEVQFTP